MATRSSSRLKSRWSRQRKNRRRNRKAAKFRSSDAWIGELSFLSEELQHESEPIGPFPSLVAVVQPTSVPVESAKDDLSSAGSAGGSARVGDLSGDERQRLRRGFSAAGDSRLQRHYGGEYDQFQHRRWRRANDQPALGPARDHQSGGD